MEREDWLDDVFAANELDDESGVGCELLLLPLPPPHAVMESASVVMLKILPKWARLNIGKLLICNSLSLYF